jgi:hypothetical protein
MAKIMFVLQRGRDQTREQCLQLWSGREAHRYRSEAPGVNQMGSKPRRIRAGRTCVRRDWGTVV